MSAHWAGRCGGPAGLLAAAIALAPTAGAAHPHVFVDAGIGFALTGSGALSGLEVTWRYDAFETLYILASLGIAPPGPEGLSAADRAAVAAFEADWPADFDGAAHLSIDGEPVALSRPDGLAVAMVDGRLQVSFARHLPAPVPMAGREAVVAVYEATYYYAFAVTDPPALSGAGAGCRTRVVPFEPDAEAAAVQATLLALGREETPERSDVGALFADRVILRCD